MKKLLMMMAMAVGFTVFAAANDPLISVNVEAGQVYELLCKGELVRTYVAPATMQMNFQCDAKLSDVESDWTVMPVAGFDIGSFVCTYPNGGTLPEGERLLLVKCTKGAGFKGLTWDYRLVDSANNEIVGVYTTKDDSGKFDIGTLGELDDEFDYVFIVLDTRLADGTPSAGNEETNPKVVGGWGEFITADGTAATASIRWTEVRMGLAESFPVSGKELDFDPTLVLEKGFAAISPSEGKWRIYQLPQAWVEPLDSPELTKGDNYYHLRTETDVPATFALESAYKFSAFDTALEPVALKFLQNNMDLSTLTPNEKAVVNAWYQQVSPFWDWNADFEVSFDREVEADSVILAGFYNYTSAWGDKYTFDWVKGDSDPWVGSSPWEKFVPGETEPIRLLKSYIGQTGGSVTMTYGEICQKVVQFLCGVKNLSEKNYGTTMTVKLCIYENTGRCNESGSKIVIGTYEYTFRGPLTVKFNYGADDPKDAPLPQEFVTNHNGKAAILLPTPSYAAKHTDKAFVGWSNQVDNVINVYVPVNTWGELNLWSAWKKAQISQVAPTGGTANVAIKVTQEWIDENVGKDASEKDVAAALSETKASEGGKIPVWQTYVLGLNPSGTVEVVATEKKSEDTALVVSTVQAPPPDSGFKVTYSLDKIEKDESVRHAGAEQDTKDIEIPLAVEEGEETPTGYYKMNVFITPVENGKEEEKVQVKAETTVGVLTVETEEKVVPVAVPWQSLADIKEDIPVNEIVQPQGLTEGDTLSVYDQEKKVYNTFVLSAGQWKPSVTYTIDSTGAKQFIPGEVPTTAKRGSGMWLNRQDTSKPFHLFGQYDNTAAKTTITPPAQGAKKPEYNLIAPTGINPVTDLNKMDSLKSDAVSEQDQLMILSKGVPTYMRFKKGEGWGYYKSFVENGRLKKVWTTDDAKVDAGTGLWYISGGGKPTIDWSEGEDQNAQ